MELRISEANLGSNEYVVIGKKIRQILDGYYAEYKQNTARK